MIAPNTFAALRRFACIGWLDALHAPGLWLTSP